MSGRGDRVRRLAGAARGRRTAGEERSERLVTNADVERLRRRSRAKGQAPLERSERRMRIVLLAPADSPHIRRWAAFCAARGFEVYGISLDSQRDPGPPVPRVRTAYLPTLRGKVASPLAAGRLRALLAQARPDVVHIQRVEGYGLLGALAARATDAPVTMVSISPDLDDSDAWDRNATRMLDVYAGLGLRAK